jgi:hypothetical protein
MPHSIESEVVILLDPVIVSQELQTGFENSAFRVLIRNTACESEYSVETLPSVWQCLHLPEHDHGTTVVAERCNLSRSTDNQYKDIERHSLVKVDPLRHFTTSDG